MPKLLSININGTEFEIGDVKASVHNLEALESIMAGKFPIGRLRVMLEEALIAGGALEADFKPILDGLPISFDKGSLMVGLYTEFAGKLLG